MRRPLFLALATVAVAGCTLGPRYSHPEVPTPDRFYPAAAPAEAASLADRPWWDLFSDPALRPAIATTLSTMRSTSSLAPGLIWIVTSLRMSVRQA